MERERSVSLASDSSSLSMDSWSLADESADEARDRQQQHNVSSSSYRRTSSGTNLSLHDSHSSSFGVSYGCENSLKIDNKGSIYVYLL